MADIFENRAELNACRERLWALIEATPWLHWLLLTKRPENIEKMVPWSGDSWPKNVWLGTTVESQEYAERRLPHLLKHAAAVRFLSCEPLLGPLNLAGWFSKDGLYPIDWVIVGGESGPGARPMYPQWAETLLDQCTSKGVAFHFKQWGDWRPLKSTDKPTGLIWVDNCDGNAVRLIRVGKKRSGRVLRGAAWDEFPKPKTFPVAL